MNELIKTIHIQQFKSLEDITIKGCRRYNLFVGRPNVGKSNILEALTLFSMPYIAKGNFSLPDFLRMSQHSSSSLFFNGDISKDIRIEAGPFSCKVHFQAADTLEIELNKEILKVVDLKVEKTSGDYPAVKPYYYGQHLSKESVNMPFLCPIGGDNLMQVLKQNDVFRSEVVKLLSPYHLKLVLDMATQEIKIMKELDEETSFIIPYEAMADSLKRLVFYKAAVQSNKDSYLLMEEPEAHSYPPYIVKVIQSMMEANTNQYFITTHSPYVINEFLENKADVAIFIVDYVEGKTSVQPLSDEQVQQIYEDGIDLFFNTEFFAE